MAETMLDTGKLRFPARLLSDWADHYDTRRNRASDFYSLKTVNEIEYDLAEVCRARNIRYALTGFSGAARYAPFVRYRRATAYLDSIDDGLIQSLRLKQVTTGGNLNLVVPDDEGVYYGLVPFDGVQVASTVQVYLDLQKAHGRGDEAADKLLQEVITPRWQEAG